MSALVASLLILLIVYFSLAVGMKIHQAEITREDLYDIINEIKILFGK